MDENSLIRLPRFSWNEIKKHWDAQTPFEAISPIATCIIRVKKYSPLIGLAMHAGHRVRVELQSKMAIEEEERTYEEDLGVEAFVEEFPIQLIGLDSRYEYDVNRPREQSVYLKPFQSWGKKVWQTPPTKEELEISYQKYDEFHELIDYFTEQSVARQGKALVLDVHSYNYRRPNLAPRVDTLPVFNLAVSDNDKKLHGKILATLTQELMRADLPGTSISVKENDVFKKDGAAALAIDARQLKALVVPVEVKKIYMDERTGQINPDVTGRLAKAMLAAAEKTLAQLLSA